tara:strand:+ start:1052 stop:1558 length:507 start_codon:yes stop_codon:yes gene_type:complete
MKFIHVFKDGKMDEIEYKDKKCNEKKLIKYFNKISKSQGSGDIKRLYSWKCDNSNILCYSWYYGENGFENKHDLPQSGISDFIDEDSSLKKLYGDIFILKSDYTDITISDYSVFYSNLCEDYSDYDSDSISEEDNVSDIENNNLDEEYEFINKDCEDLDELEYDDNDY